MKRGGEGGGGQENDTTSKKNDHIQYKEVESRLFLLLRINVEPKKVKNVRSKLLLLLTKRECLGKKCD